jgi:hypothetical protein
MQPGQRVAIRVDAEPTRGRMVDRRALGEDLVHQVPVPPVHHPGIAMEKLLDGALIVVRRLHLNYPFRRRIRSGRRPT